MNAIAALIEWPDDAFDEWRLALWTSAELAEAMGGEASGAFEVSGVEIDSRDVVPGDLFFALSGETTDGHRFLDAAFAKGAAAAVVDRKIEQPHILVSDTGEALRRLAQASRARVSSTCAVVGVTGSVGKTSVKEALFAALDRASHGRAHRSVKSYNNHVGVPLSLARMPSGARFGVFEMGMNHAGEIAGLTVQVRPHVALVTTIAPAHIENLGSEEAIADAKAEIFRGLEEGGVAVIPADTPHFARLRAAALLVRAEVVSFGRSADADVRLLDAVPAPGGGSLVTAELRGGEGDDRRVCYTVAAPGEHWVVNSLAVMAAVRAAGGDLGAAGLALAEMEGLKGRGARHQIALAGGGTALLIDESYNANPASMAATLAQLGDTPATRRIAVLGAMKELGEHGRQFHADLAGPLRDAGVDQAFLVGDEMTALADELGKSQGPALGKAVPFAHCRSAAEALEALAGYGLRQGDAVLVKGSNSVGLGTLVEALVPVKG